MRVANWVAYCRGIVARPLDIPLVEPVKVTLEPALDLRADRTFGVLGEELPGPLDLVGQGHVGERLGLDQVVDDPPLDGGLPGRQLGLERPGEGERLGTAGGVGIRAEECVDRRQRGSRGRRWRPATGPLPGRPSSARHAAPAPGRLRPC